jgi:hypothetical protein
VWITLAQWVLPGCPLAHDDESEKIRCHHELYSSTSLALLALWSLPGACCPCHLCGSCCAEAFRSLEDGHKESICGVFEGICMPRQKCSVGCTTSESRLTNASAGLHTNSSSVCVVLHVAVFTGTSATRPVSPHTSSPRFTTSSDGIQAGYPYDAEGLTLLLLQISSSAVTVFGGVQLCLFGNNHSPHVHSSGMSISNTAANTIPPVSNATCQQHHGWP